jgi:hypothetical protein
VGRVAGFGGPFRLFFKGVTEKLSVFGWFFVVSLWCFGGEIVVFGGLFFPG